MDWAQLRKSSQYLASQEMIKMMQPRRMVLLKDKFLVFSMTCRESQELSVAAVGHSWTWWKMNDLKVVTRYFRHFRTKLILPQKPEHKKKTRETNEPECKSRNANECKSKQSQL